MKRITIPLVLLTLLAATFAQAATTFQPGHLLEEFWAGKNKDLVEAGTAGTPTYTSILDTFEIPSDTADNYGARVSGYFVPAVTADYDFNISADDFADLFLSTDEDPAHKTRICQQIGWNATRNWEADNGGNFAQRISGSIHLIAGNHYYIEGVMSEFGGGDNLAVSYRYPAGSATPTVGFPVTGDPPNIDASLIATSVTSPTVFAITSQPQNTTVFAGRTATFSIVVNSDAKVNGTVISPLYQWRKGGTNILNATLPTLSYAPSLSDDQAEFDCVVSFPASTGLTDTLTSTKAKLTVQAGQTVTAQLKDEFFSGKTRAEVEQGAGGVPTYIDGFTAFHAPVNVAEGFTRRVSGLFTPATSGNYVFFVCSDDDSDLFLSTDDSPSHKRLIAQETAWSNDLEWTASGGSSSLTQKRSDQFSPDGGTTMPYSAGIPLVAATKYYIEGVAHEGGGGDDFAATFKLMADPDPTDGTASALTGSLISFITSPITTLSISGQPQNVDTYESLTLTLSVTLSTDSELTPLYQWRKAGVAIPGAIGSIYSRTAGLSDAGSYDVVVTLPNSSLTATSTVATVVVHATPFVTGFLKYEIFPLHTRQEVEAGTAGSASTGDGVHNVVGQDKSGAIKTFEAGVNILNAINADFIFSDRISGYFVPPATGEYNWVTAADDDTDLFLSTDESPANKRLVAQETGWSAVRNWTTANGGSSTQKHSESFDPGDMTTPFASGITMTQGQKYYFEAIAHEGGGGDNLAVTFWMSGPPPNDTLYPVPADGEAPRLTGNVIGIKVPPQNISITTQPADITVAAATFATFTVAATTDGFYNPTYQWQKGTTDLPGETGTTLNYLTTLADNNATFRCVVSIFGQPPSVNSTAATLHVTPDTTPPTVVAVVGEVTFAKISFSELMDPVIAADKSHYNITPGITVNSATSSDLVLGNTQAGIVTLAISGATIGQSYSLTITGVKDKAGNVMPTATVSFTAAGKIYDFDDNQIPAGVVLNGSAKIQNGVLQLTDNVNGLLGGALLPDPFGGVAVTNFTFKWRQRVGYGTGNPADGMSFNYATDVTPTAVGEDGTGTGLSVNFDTYDNGATEAPSIDVRWGGSVVAGGHVRVLQNELVTGLNSFPVDQQPGRWVDVQVDVDNGGTVSVLYDGVLIYDHLDLTSAGYAPLTGASMLIGGRTGGENSRQEIDDLTFIANVPDNTPPTPVNVRRSFSANTTVTVKFAEVVDATTANNAANYKINNGSIAVTAAALGADRRSVVLTTAAIANGTTATLSVTGVKDVAGNVATDSQMGITLLTRTAYMLVQGVAGTDELNTFHTDYEIAEHLANRGYDVALISSETDAAAGAAGKNIIIVSSSLGSATVAGDYKSTAVPLLTWESAIQDDERMAAADGTGQGVTAGKQTITIVDSSHPMAAGFPAGDLVIQSAKNNTLNDMTWGIPDANAQIVATIQGEPTHACVYGYEKGAVLTDGSTAAERRAILPMSDVTFSYLNSAGVKIFDAAVDWVQSLTTAVAGPKFTSIVKNANGSLTVTWTGGGTLQASTDLKTWTDITPAASPYTFTPPSAIVFGRIKL